ncbi:MAG: MoaD/ThiS family protein [Methanobrevibacter woesei]|uniref:MoaD/ThiS family protein n=1 Tax=Methanobrevibacter woesei TaxID=190976 RepID=UPI0023F14784|nr:MoaD/ThiS family protein [Methanobrevibacter woesei]MCI7290859.1 MoaD/ThiS family protein [Methanobrevibacter woesei]
MIKISFTLKIKDKIEDMELPHDDFTIEDLFNQLELSSQLYVPKQNGEIVIKENKINNGDEIQLVQIIYGG